MNSKIRVGIVAANPSRGFASIAHIPALQALPDFEISAVCTTRQDSAEAAATPYGVPLAFCDAQNLAQHPAVDLVTVSVKVPDHYLPVMAAIEAGKHVYCEWPLGRNTDISILSLRSLTHFDSIISRQVLSRGGGEISGAVSRLTVSYGPPHWALYWHV